MQHLLDGAPAKRNKYIHVKAEDGKNITVFGLNDENVSTDAFLALPCQSYDGITPGTPYEYFIFSANSTQAPGGTWILCT